MAPDEQVQWIQVPRHDVALTLDDILVPLMESSTGAAEQTVSRQPDEQVLPDLVRLSELAAELKAVADRIDAVQPELLAPGHVDVTGPPDPPG